MIETTVGIDGMQCGMCEAHVNDTIRAAFPVKKVSASHKKGQAAMWSIYRQLKGRCVCLV